jgi:hypothetical protein
LRFRVWSIFRDLETRNHRLGFVIWILEFGVWDLWFKNWGLKFIFYCFRFWVLGFEIWGLEYVVFIYFSLIYTTPPNPNYQTLNTKP